MEDSQILDLFRKRSEDAIAETDRKYGRYCHSIAGNILPSHQDCEECVNDTYLHTWNSIPPQMPNRFQAFLGRITRNLAISRFRSSHAEKRGGSQVPQVLEELEEVLPGGHSPEEHMEQQELARLLTDFIDSLKPDARKYFVQRYWYMMPVRRIAFYSGVTESKVKMSLHRSRAALRERLKKEGIEL